MDAPVGAQGEWGVTRQKCSCCSWSSVGGVGAAQSACLPAATAASFLLLVCWSPSSPCAEREGWAAGRPDYWMK